MSTRGVPSAQALASAAERLGPWFHLLACQLPVGVLILDSEGAPVFANDPALELLGLTDLETDRERFGRLAELAQVDLARRESTILVGTPDGSPREVLLHTKEVDDEGTIVILEDRHKRVALSESMTLASRMRTLGVLRSQAHDLKAPLNSLALNLEVLRKTLEAEDDKPAEVLESQLATADLLRREIARLGRGLDAFLRRTTDRPRQERSGPFSVRQLVRDLARLLRPTAQESGVRIRTSHSDEALRARGNGDRVHQALLNVVLNAVEAQAGGAATDEARRGEVRIRVDRKGRRVRIRVEDDGPGIPAPLLRKVFEMNYTTKAEGTGIGLTVARSLIEAQQGSLELRNGPRGGAIVTVLLPACD